MPIPLTVVAISYLETPLRISRAVAHLHKLVRLRYNQRHDTRRQARPGTTYSYASRTDRCSRVHGEDA
jgi:hypothetical protein